MWELEFISEEDFTNHVKSTIKKYGQKLESYDLKKFNSNIIDPIKLVFVSTHLTALTHLNFYSYMNSVRI